MSKYTKDGQITTSEVIRANNPNLGIPEGADLSDIGWFLVNEIPQPSFNHVTQRCVDSGLAEFVNEQWQTLWVISAIEPSSTVPQSVTAFQAKSSLLAGGYLDQAIAATTTAGGVVKLQWETQPNFTRSCSAMKFIQRRIGLSDEQVDDLFTVASQLSLDPVVDVGQITKAAEQLFKANQIRDERDRRKLNGVFINYCQKWIHTDVFSRTQWLGMLSAVIAGITLPSDPPWTTMDKSTIPLSATLVQAVFQAVMVLDATTFGTCSAKIAAMMLLDDPTTYDYLSGWPTTFGD